MLHDTSQFDQSLFVLKLQQPAIRMHEETESRRLRVRYECRKAGRSKGAGLFIALMSSDFDVLRNYVANDVDRICREVWQAQGNPITAEFVRGCLLPHVMATVEGRASTIKANIERIAARTHFSHSLRPVDMYFGRALRKIKSTLSNQYEVEARELEWKHAKGRIEESKQKEQPRVRLVTASLPPPREVGGVGLASHSPKPTQVPPDWPSDFPEPLRPKTQVIIYEACRHFGDQTRILELCKYVICKLTPVFSEAVQVGIVQPSTVGGHVERLLHSVIVYNCHYSRHGHDLEREARNSEEMFKLINEVLRVTSNIDTSPALTGTAERCSDDVSNGSSLESPIGKVKHAPMPKGGEGRKAHAEPYPTCRGQNIDRLRRECGWSFDELEKQTGLEKKLILSHVNSSRMPRPSTLKLYADAFTRALRRPVTVTDLEK